MPNIDELRQKTYEEAVDILKTHGTCCIIRPTGFGKTGILARFITEGNHTHILYLYPTKTVRNTAENFCRYFGHPGALDHVTFYSYIKIQKLSDKELHALKDVDLIICDECHKLGGTMTMAAYEKLTNYLPDAYTLGATATPERMDLIDVVKTFYADHVVSRYTAHDAFTDDVLYRPHYVYCSYEETDIKEAKARAKKEIALADPSDRKQLLQNLEHRIIQISRLHKMDRIIRKTCDMYAPDTNCMTFIVFFANYDHIRGKAKNVAGWFKDAYPDHDVVPITVTAEKKEYRDNVDIIEDLPYKDKTIYLIETCDMLNLGYHVSRTTGILMYRCTNSNTIFVQQLGRIISANISGILFDAVDNMHRMSMYKVLGKRSEKTLKRKARLAELKEKYADGTITETEEKELKRLTREFYETKWWKNANDIEPKDLLATGHEAEYRELIAKIEAEPIAMRCRQAWARWIEKGGDASVMNRNTILAQKDPEHVPLLPFCRLKKVTIEMVLKEMGL